ncbi:uncharacterized protein LOC105797444 [Gossypium raimondii]|uniref:uncharacterized protein LOC105797444 n=1 Tax=Gossypium raimondii TaxID=29730 RepID=UPI00227D62A8|nr:uncharacterized protein LOC105797444 [Gossypium raimondii]
MAEGAGEEKKKFSIWDLPDVPMGQLPPHLELQRSRVSCNKDAPIHVDGLSEFMEFTLRALGNSLLLSLSIVENDQPNEKNTIVFKLHVQCKRGSPRITVKSDALKWLPNGSELVKETRNAASDSSSKPETYTYFGCSQETIPEFVKNPIIPKYPDIIIAKLGPGQEIELEAHAAKGIGKTHAKWSPVATAWYRMLPEVVLLEDIEDDLAEELKSKCPVNVFDIEDLGKVTSVHYDLLSIWCKFWHVKLGDIVLGTFPNEEFGCQAGRRRATVALRRVKDHFIFTIESTGALPPEVLFTEAVKILEDECERVITELS